MSMRAFYFSPKGTTKRVAQAITDAMGGAQERDLVVKPLGEDLALEGQAPVLVAVPVYAGRVPAVAREMIGRLKGHGAPAIAVVVYGNRAYDDALLELRDLLEAQGFCVVGAGAFVAEHSIFPKVARWRPDGQDRVALADFAARCQTALAAFNPQAHTPVLVKGNPVYCDYPRVPMAPTGNKNCIKCRACVTRCPVDAIPAADPKGTDTSKCISCGACIYICPVEARGYFTPEYQAAAAEFEARCAQRKEPEIFFN